MGAVIKPGSDRSHVAKSTSNTAKNFGIAQNAADNAGDLVEVSLQGGGGKGLAGGDITFGDMLTSDGNGALIVTTTAGDRVVAMAMEDAAAGDLFAVEVINVLI
jgi:hypothetical protein